MHLSSHTLTSAAAGKHEGRAVAPSDSGELTLELSWGAPFAGSGTDVWSLGDDGTELTVSSTIRIDGRSCSYRTVYRKKS